MQGLAHSYATAIFDLAVRGDRTDTLLARLDEVLAAHGHTKLKPDILRELARIAQEAEERETPTVTVARDEHETSLSDRIARARESLGASRPHRTSVDPRVIGGYRVEANHRQIDATYKTALLKLYRNITRNAE